ncbi:sulfurtransferase [Agromyces sp. NBRC 114283]|uniref:sulfurtransferase n=1 Tax=Agromyces sp. NBRC 114283 TaxID=2994521 RepID=UPI0024A0F78B|nr:sulfurtransferase [Agromyces sp. NBRC 114283]GLU88730.1 sulfurtransferase [Agromyces sp. NBRC 114283]
MSILITAEELAERLADEASRPVVLDVRWSLAAPDGRPAYLAGHVPGAVYVDLETELTAPPSPAAGRHPLPDEAAFIAAMRRWGVREGDAVVVMDDLGNQSAARAWWLLRHAGVADVRMLDGGLAAWRAAGGTLETGDVEAEPGDATAHFGAMPVIDADAAAALPEHGVLLDARAAERYRGEVEPIDPAAGHIPGARSAPSAGNLDADGRFLPPEALRERFAALGADGERPVAVYCGSGVTASHGVAALALAGVAAALYPGSWSQWSNDPARPVATGDEPEQRE